MTPEDIFQTLLQFAYAFGCDIIEADEDGWPKDRKENRGFFYISESGMIMKRQDMEIWLKSDLELEEKILTLSHETGHLALWLLKVQPYQKETHQPTADLFGYCLVATLKEDWENPLFRISGITDLIKRFLELLKAKRERTALGLAQLDEAYFKWLEKQDGKEG